MSSAGPPSRICGSLVSRKVAWQVYGLPDKRKLRPFGGAMNLTFAATKAEGSTRPQKVRHTGLPFP